jgi:hypothetical protein
MAWYRTGTVSVTNGSTAVTGSGTNFVAGAQVGEGFAAPDGRLYEIVTIVSATSLTIGKAYLGSTQTGQTYEIVPTQSLVADLAGQVSTLISDFQSVADEAGEGKFDYGTAASPGITFTLDQDTGFFHDTNNEIGVSAGGTKVADFNSGGLSFPSGKGVVGNADLGGNITLSRATGSVIRRTTDTDYLALQGGTSGALSANIVMYGSSNVSLPNWNVIKGDKIVFQPVDGSPSYLDITDGTGTVFNESGADLDFRIESDINTHAFFLQGSDGFTGINTSSPLTQLHVDAGTKNYTGTTPGLGTYAVSIESGSTGTCGIGIGSHNNIPSIQGFGGGTGYNLALCPANGNVSVGTSTALGQFVSERPAGAGWALAGKTAGIANEGGLFFNATNDGELVARNASGTVNVSLKSNGSSYLNGGSVAIGHTSPSQALDVVGSIEVSGGIYLGGTAAANLLDDYEEGTWTPAFIPATGAFGSITYAFNTGTYTKVGRLVTVTGRIQVSATPPTIGTAGANCYLSGFPFVIASGQGFYGAMSFTFITGWSDSFAPNSAYISQGSSIAVLMKRPVSDNKELVFTPADFISGGANSGLMFTGTYFTN